MNYDEARELKDGGGWRWTTMNDGQVQTAWPCRRYITPAGARDPERYHVDADDFEHCAPHATKEEAEQHFYEACLDSVQEVRFGDWHGCSACDTPTKMGLGNRLLSLCFRPRPLCDKHRNRETLRELQPFQPGLSLIHS